MPNRELNLGLSCRRNSHFRMRNRELNLGRVFLPMRLPRQSYHVAGSLPFALLEMRAPLPINGEVRSLRVCECGLKHSGDGSPDGHSPLPVLLGLIGKLLSRMALFFTSVNLGHTGKCTFLTLLLSKKCVRGNNGCNRISHRTADRRLLRTTFRLWHKPALARAARTASGCDCGAGQCGQTFSEKKGRHRSRRFWLPSR
jgi:hypothetical protein